MEDKAAFIVHCVAEKSHSKWAWWLEVGRGWKIMVELNKVYSLST